MAETWALVSLTATKFAQTGYFDHRLRDDERGEQLAEKINYIRQNPVAAGLCATADDWLWRIEHSARDT